MYLFKFAFICAFLFSISSAQNCQSIFESKTIDYFSNELHINKYTPPALLIHSIDDDGVSVENSITYLKGLKRYGIKSGLHVFSDGGHGYGLGRGGTHSFWTKNAENWLNFLLKK